MSNPTYVVTQTRFTVLELLKARDYNTSQYEAIDVKTLEDSVLQDITKQTQSDSLRMDISHKTDTDKKACVLFLLYPIKAHVTNGTLLDSIVNKTIADLKGEPNVSIRGSDGELTATEVIINYSPAEANEDTAPYDKMAYQAWKRHKLLIQFFPLGTLVSNPLKHILQPKFDIVRDKEEKEKIMKFWYAKSASQFPLIRFHSDMAARCLGLEPGDFVKITTASLTAGEYVKYRVCQP